MELVSGSVLYGSSSIPAVLLPHFPRPFFPDTWFFFLLGVLSETIAPWAFYAASSALPICSYSSLACKLCWQDPGTLMALTLKKPAALSFSSSYGRGGWASGASQWCPLPSSKLLHCSFKAIWGKQCPGDFQRSCREGSGFIWALRPVFCREPWPGGACSSCLPGYGAVVGKCYCRYTPVCHKTLLRLFPVRHSCHVTFSMPVP